MRDLRAAPLTSTPMGRISRIGTKTHSYSIVVQLPPYTMHVSFGTAILFKITHCKKSTVSPIYHDLPPLFWWEGLDGSACVDDVFDDLRKRVRQCGPSNSLGGLKLDLGNFNTEFFEGRNR